MKKLPLVAACFAFASAVHAEKLTETADIIQIPEQYLKIDKGCQNSDVYKYNACLKKALFKIMSETLTEEQIKDLKSQIAGIEREVNTAELDYNDPQAKAADGNESKINELRAESMNLIWKRILIETLNSLNAVTAEQNI